MDPAAAEPLRPHDGRWVAADARFGVEGLPQSGTGQTALLTGAPAPKVLGRHFGPWVPTALRRLLARENLLSRAAEAGWATAFANATPLSQAEGDSGRWRRPAAMPLAAHGAGLPRRDLAELRARRAVASSITNEKWRRYADPALPDISPAAAAAVLAEIAAGHALTLFAHYDTDFAGHTGSFPAAVEVLERVDAFLGGLLAELGPRTLLVIASDHGNVEDVSAGHTLNPVPVIATGPGARGLLDAVADIADVAPAILAELERVAGP